MLTRLERKSIKKEATKNVRRRYVMNIIVVFALSFLANGSHQFTNIHRDLTSEENISQRVKGAGNFIIGIVNDPDSYMPGGPKTNTEILREFVINTFGIKQDDSKRKHSRYTEGVISTFVNEISASDSFLYGIINAFNRLVFDGRLGLSINIFLFSFLLFLGFIFIKNILVIGRNRYFLEQRRYLYTIPTRIIYGYRGGNVKNIAYIMILKYLKQVLWACTIVCFPRKYYEYKMIPYILAENPRIKCRDAFELSRELIEGEKKNLFVMDLSLFGWRILSYLTFRLTAIFYSDAYIECVYSEFYIRLRRRKKDTIRLGYLLDDDYLDVKEPKNMAYPSKYPPIEIPFIATVSRIGEKVHYRRDYTVTSTILLFFTYALVGWIWEVIYTLATQGMIANRGFLNGPWVPIYGFGGLIIINLFIKIRERPVLLFVSSALACGAMEYITGVVLEKCVNKKWWDYTGYFLNIDGKVCLEGVLLFGFAGLLFTYIFSPVLDTLYSKINKKVRIVLCVVLIILFIIDVIMSINNPNVGVGITDYE